LINIHFPSKVDAFAFGAFVAGLECGWKGLPKSWVRLGDIGMVLLTLTLGIYCVLIYYHLQIGFLIYTLIEVLVRFSTALLLCYSAQPQHPRAQLLCLPWLRWCGLISYEWYLFHQPLLIWSRQFNGSARDSLLHYLYIVGIPVALGLIFSATVYRFFSLPILRLGRNAVRRATA
jgi:peptidoglycan/LPS O-acetylase OafA/YrhL